MRRGGEHRSWGQNHRGRETGNQPMLRSRSEARAGAGRRHAQEPVNSATHERSPLVQEHPVAESAGDEHAAAGGDTSRKTRRRVVFSWPTSVGWFLPGPPGLAQSGIPQQPRLPMLRSRSEARAGAGEFCDSRAIPPRPRAFCSRIRRRRACRSRRTNAAPCHTDRRSDARDRLAPAEVTRSRPETLRVIGRAGRGRSSRSRQSPPR
jgi:hypothetical protein